MGRHIFTSLIVMAAMLAICVPASADAPFTLDELFRPPYIYGTSPRSIAISDDGMFVACGWDAESESTRDLWIYDVAGKNWTQHTDLWPEHEARRRREFSRELNQARQDWEEAHPVEAETEDSADGTEEGAEAAEGDDDVASGDDEEFNEEERIEEFEEELEKQRERFSGIGNTVFRRGTHELFWLRHGVIYSLNLDEATPTPRERFRHESGIGSFYPAEDEDVFLVTSGSDYLLWYPGDGRLRQITSGGGGDLSNTSGAALNRDASLLAYGTRDYRGTRKTKMIEFLTDNPYTTEHGQVRPADTPERVKLTIIDLTETPPWPVEIELPEEPFYQLENIDWSPNPGDDRLLLGIISGDARTYRAYLVELPEDDLAEPELTLIYEEEDEAWVNWSRTGVRWGNDGRLLLQSEKDGWAGIYELHEAEVVELVNEGDAAGSDAGDGEEGEAEDETGDELTATHEPQLIWGGDGEEVSWFRALRHTPRVIYATDGGQHETRGMMVGDLRSGEAAPLTAQTGWNDSLTMSEDETRFTFVANSLLGGSDLMLGALPQAGVADARVLLSHLPDTEEARKWQVWRESWDVRFIKVPVAQYPEFGNIYREDDLGEGREIAVKLFLPPDYDECGEYPLLIWIHGAGYAQAVKDTLGFYEKFHPWVVYEHGWIVAEVDYRGSAGYGRDWRVDVKHRLGHPETEDLIAVKRHLVENYGGDPVRTALWGWSYGGFQTLMCLGLAPGEFPVGCGVAPVNRWENYFYWYSTERLDHPADNEEGYDRSAPETWLEHITDELLIIHGLRDNNTLFQSIAQYLEEGHELGINIELKLFPSDAHGISNDYHYIRVYEGVVDYCLDHWPAEE